MAQYLLNICMRKIILFYCLCFFCCVVHSQPYITSTVQINNPPPCTLCCNGSVSFAVNGFSCALGPFQVGIQSATSGTMITWNSGALYNLCNGTYTVYIDFLGGPTCGAFLVCYPIYLSATKLNEKLETNSGLVKLFPNPASDELNITINAKTNTDLDHLIIYNAIGQIIREEEFILTNNSVSINTTDLPNGVYYLGLNGINKRFIITK